MRKIDFQTEKKLKHLGKRIEDKFYIQGSLPTVCALTGGWPPPTLGCSQLGDSVWQQTLHSPLWYQEISCDHFCVLVAYSPFLTAILQYLHQRHPVILFLGSFHH